MRIEVNAKGLTPSEIQAAIDSAISFKNKSITELMAQQRERILELMKLDKEFAGMALNRQNHPDLTDEK